MVPDSDGEIFTFRVEDISTTDVDDPQRPDFSNFRPIPSKAIKTADGRVFYATGEGDVLLPTNIPHSLISISRACPLSPHTKSYTLPKGMVLLQTPCSAQRSCTCLYMSCIAEWDMRTALRC